MLLDSLHDKNRIKTKAIIEVIVIIFYFQVSSGTWKNVGVNPKVSVEHTNPIFFKLMVRGNKTLLNKRSDIERKEKQRLLKEKNIKISSTRIRSAIEKGRFDIVNKLLGREWSILEKVIPGRKVARSLGFRTANIVIKKKH